ncbi:MULTISPECIES: SDR family NAD(P)-dependent oxidoreductase [unclassified Pseudoalteromonas]|uniref:SDR family NAD(P)-dependent oxidoreductase n=1 Tax=unclassified Pseudoalteromonas TaxID=194690 RepID=UPI0025B5D4F7|nr:MULTISPECIES: SDR family NAD(P)-dependent oxidoreductase [unclassified Pseudoalteromonas]MDN3379158.1 SDR family NAD(P)-dependent oxidoreductase [Pseudoalteromonas sp. APC 3893]MDN3387653.1 SDR family NAD(P)-dependent oxidoreductase [Pseudoalteromonas sp. APC 4017]
MKLVNVTLDSHGIALVEMQDRQNKNLVTLSFIDAVSNALHQLQDQAECKVIILTGYDQYFCCGGSQEGLYAIQQGTTVCTDGVLHTLPLTIDLPVIAAMQGHAIGSGWIMGMSCDISIFSSQSVYHCPFMELGFTPGAGATRIFPLRFGPRFGREILFEAKEYKGRELQARNIDFTVVSRDQVVAKAYEYARELCQYDRESLVENKLRLVSELREELEDVFAKEIAMHEKTFVGNQKVVDKVMQRFSESDHEKQSEQEPQLNQAVKVDKNQLEKDVEQKVMSALVEELGESVNDIDAEDDFAKLGMDSVVGVVFVKKLNAMFQAKIDENLKASVLYEYSSPLALTKHIVCLLPSEDMIVEVVNHDHPESQTTPRDTAEIAVTSTQENLERTYRLQKDQLHKDLEQKSLEQEVKKLLAEELGSEDQSLDLSLSFHQMGLDSVTGVRFIRSINEAFQLKLKASSLYEYGTAREFLDSLMALTNVQNLQPSFATEKPQSSAETNHSVALEDLANMVAVIGVAGKFPLANQVKDYWQNLMDGVDCVRTVPDSRWQSSHYFDESAKTGSNKSYSKRMGMLEGIDEFDAAFFKLTFAEAEMMDPQERLFLQCAWHCLEDAGYTPEQLAQQNCGVFVGCTPVADYHDRVDAIYLNSAISGSVVAGRVSYLFNLKGPSLAIDTACSSSLTAVAQACESIRTGQSSTAIAGGCSVLVTPKMHIMTSNANMLSRRGRCATFDQGADGFIPAEGAGAVLLKSAEQAVKDGDNIYGFICGWGINQDGKTNGITAPNPASQSRLMSDVYQRFGIDKNQIQYLETHGTGTELGDPIEVDALLKTFAGRSPERKCVLGAVKANLGHLMAASGVAGLIKVLGAINQNMIPPSIHFQSINPKIELDDTPFQIVTEASQWPESNTDRMAAVSSFGLSGTNAHLVVKGPLGSADESCRASQTPNQLSNLIPKECQGFLLSAKSLKRLFHYAADFLHFLNNDFAEAELPSLLYTLQVGRVPMSHRLVIEANDLESIRRGLKRFIEKNSSDGMDISDLAPQVCYCNTLETPNASFSDVAPSSFAQPISQWLNGGAIGDTIGNIIGNTIDWHALWTAHGKPPKRVALPVYPFEPASFWLGDSRRPEVMSLPSWQPLSISEDLNTGDDQTITENRQATKLFARRKIAFLDISPTLQDALKQSVDSEVLAIEAIHAKKDQWFIDLAVELFAYAKESLAEPSRPELIQLLVAAESQALDAVTACNGLFKTIKLEKPGLIMQVVMLTEDVDANRLLNLLSFTAAYGQAGVFQLSQEGIHHRQWQLQNIAALPEPQKRWKNHGVYLITGGLGGIGQIFAKDLLKSVQGTRLYLLGRSSLTGERLESVTALQRLYPKSQIEYRSIDVNDGGAVSELLAEIKRQHGKLDGIIHSAGVANDDFIRHKSRASFAADLSTKVTGTANLDRACQGLTLDFFVMFSSIASVIGNVGQSAYATANSFMDSFANYHQLPMDRNNETAGGHYRKVLSINWPLWRDGGMSVDSVTQQSLYDNLGMQPLTAQQGLFAFHSLLSADVRQAVVMSGDKSAISDILNEQSSAAKPKALTTESRHAGAQRRSEQKPTEQLKKQQPTRLQPKDALYEQINRSSAVVNVDLLTAKLKGILEQVTRIPAADLDALAPLENYGIDSIKVMSLNQLLAPIFGELSKTLFFEHQNIKKVAQYLCDEYSSSVIRWCEEGGQYEDGQYEDGQYYESTTDDHFSAAALDVGVNDTDIAKPNSTEELMSGRASVDDAKDIAIIGLAGQYPGANNLTQFWQNLAEGVVSIEEVPIDRWDMEQLFEPDPIQSAREHKSYCKWGGFLHQYAEFDSAFFGVLPKEALNIDPQERLFLQSCWHTLEDAGYPPHRLQQVCAGRVGVFAGITKTGYELYLPELWRSGSDSIPRTSFSSVANRVSYLFNLNGPSFSVDTMCSSSLLAIHLAVQSIRSNECDMALAGGVNLYLHPSCYAVMSAQQMLSSDGRCHTFADSANGFVPGEGVGSLLLKPKQQAIQDNDNIYGIIVGSATSHNGKTNGYTVPSPTAQAALVSEALRQASLAPSDISYIEAHGTGTRLGDPIEVNGLKQSFRQFAKQSSERRLSDNRTQLHACALGSVKSNIGHLEAAAGIAGITKVLLQLKHQKLVPSVGAEPLNSHIDFADSPFYVQTHLSDWQVHQGQPLRAGISSFGAGGSNVHMIIEQWSPATQALSASFEMPPSKTENLFVLSAKSESQLKELVQSLLVALESLPDTPDMLDRVAFTLQVGRQHQVWRLAVTASSLTELSDKMSRVSGDREWKQQIFWLNQSLEAIDELTKQIGAEQIKQHLTQQNFQALSRFWCQGVELDWQKLYAYRGSTRVPQVISLPLYPFSKEKYRIKTEGITNNELEKKEQESDRLSTYLVTDDWVDVPATTHSEVSSVKFQVLALGLGELEIQKLEAKNTGNSIVVQSLCNNKFSQEVLPEEWFSEIFIRCFRLIKSLAENNQPQLDSVLLLHKYPEGSLQRLGVQAVTALLRSASLETGSLQFRSVELDDKSQLSIEQQIHENLFDLNNDEVRYTHGKRQVRQFFQQNLPTKNRDITYPWQDSGVYLITGGSGQIAQHFAREIAKQCHDAKIILASRSTPENTERLAKECQGCQLIFETLDVGDEAQVFQTIRKIVQNLGKLTGIIHCAGTLNDSYAIKKSEQEFLTTLKPKVHGLTFLDNATWNLPLELFVTCSSISATLGNVGQTDYATANAFMDQFCSYRQNLTARGLRSGRTLSLAWPLWESGGMSVDYSVQSQLQDAGLGMLSLKSAWQFFYHAWTQDKPVCRALVARDEVLETLMNQQPGLKLDAAIDSDLTSMTEFQDHLVDLFCEETGINPADFSVDHDFSQIGLDSIVINLLNSKLEAWLGVTDKTLFYKHKTLASLVSALWPNYSENHREKVAGRLSQSMSHKIRQDHRKDPAVNSKQSGSKIAVIGMTGRFPGAKNIEEYWNNLLNARNSIGEIPVSRWDVAAFFNSDRDKAVLERKSYSKWGGFLEGFAQFDTEFFGISPWEAENMDPQERLFIECCWNVLEDAGYTPSSLNQSCDHRVAVFAGITKTGFNLYCNDYWAKGEDARFYTSFSSVANRISYLFDFHGTSMPIDTMCSSSLVAIHMAADQLRARECNAAIAGGVNLYLHPSSYVLLSAQQMLSSDGICRSFGVGGDGFVPGEGCGAILLKRLTDAEADNDAILGTILGSHVNHGGRTHGYTVPDPVAQSKLMVEAIRKAKVPASSISYIEAHGTGTDLGDPIEIEGINLAFAEFETQGDKRKRPCVIGSVKANIGHLESAAGIASVIKVLCQFQNRMLVPSINSQQLNPKIDFKAGNLIVQQNSEPWFGTVEGGSSTPLRAGVSSFGAAGVNAHLILEEYSQPELSSNPNTAGLNIIDQDTIYRKQIDRNQTDRNTEEATTRLIILSAKTLSDLFSRVNNLQQWISENNPSDQQLARLAYTLQTGRESFDYRLVCQAATFAQLNKRLFDIVTAGEDSLVDNPNVSRTRQAKQQTVAMDKLSSELTITDLNKLAEYWLSGGQVAWHNLYSAPQQKIRLPSYPFAGDSYWVSDLSSAGVENDNVKLFQDVGFKVKKSNPLADNSLIPMSLNPNAFYLRDHLVNGTPVLPGVAHLEIAVQATFAEFNRDSRSSTQVILNDLVWARAVAVNDEKVIGLTCELTNDKLQVSINDLGQSDIYFQCKTQLEASSSAPVLALDKLKAHINQLTLKQAELYPLYEQYLIQYGTSMRAIQRMHLGADARQQPQVLAQLSLPECVQLSKEEFHQHPSLLDGALQTTLGLVYHELQSDEISAVLPFAVDQVRVLKPLESELWVWTRYAQSQLSEGETRKVNMDICDSSGEVLVQLIGLAMRAHRLDLQPPNFDQDINENNKRPSLLATRELNMVPVWERVDRLPSEVGSNTNISALESDSGIKAFCIASSIEVLDELSDTFKTDKGILLNPEQTVEELTQILTQLLAGKSIEQLVWALEPARGTEAKTDAMSQSSDAYYGFKLVKALLSLGYENKPMQWLVYSRHAFSYKSDLTNGDSRRFIRPPATPAFHAALSGFLGSVAKEYPRWDIVHLDSDGDNPLSSLSRDWSLSRTVASQTENYRMFAIRKGHWYQQELNHFEPPVSDSSVVVANPGFKENGVYLIVGGAGGIGMEFSQYLVATYRAKIIWFGRRPMDADINHRLDKLAALGRRPTYYSVDVTDFHAAEIAVHQMLAHYPSINGIIHSAGVIKDKSLARMTDEEFLSVLASKSDIAINIDRLLHGKVTDFVLFFSSIQSFGKEAGQANYAAGCQFQDNFAAQIAPYYPCPVRVINWGFWSGVGMGADEYLKDRMAQLGLASVTIEDAVKVIEQALSQPAKQTIYLKINREDLHAELVKAKKSSLPAQVEE